MFINCLLYTFILCIFAEDLNNIYRIYEKISVLHYILYSKDVTLPKNDVRTDDIRSANARTSTCAIRTLVISHHESGLQRRAAAPVGAAPTCYLWS